MRPTSSARRMAAAVEDVVPVALAEATPALRFQHQVAGLVKARTPAVLTLTVQITNGASGYLPTERGVQGGGYSAEHYLVGPEGGKVLVNETVKRLGILWP